MKLVSPSGVVVHVSDRKGAELLKSGGFTLPEQEKAPAKKTTRRKTAIKNAAPAKETAAK